MSFKSMPQPATEIPDKLFYKIGEVCEIVGVQAHVLRYWETEFPMLQPQKNPSGQRTYRRRDVEMAMRIKQLLYEEGFTIAGAKRKLATENRGGQTRLKIVPPGATASDFAGESTNGSGGPPPPIEPPTPPITPITSRMSRDTLKRLRLMAEDLLTTLNRDVTTAAVETGHQKSRLEH
ncbi:MAG: MerR family transcriptional regulator [Acidobacteriota bacterium]